VTYHGSETPLLWKVGVADLVALGVAAGLFVVAVGHWAVGWHEGDTDPRRRGRALAGVGVAAALLLWSVGRLPVEWGVCTPSHPLKPALPPLVFGATAVCGGAALGTVTASLRGRSRREFRRDLLGAAAVPVTLGVTTVVTSAVPTSVEQLLFAAAVSLGTGTVVLAGWTLGRTALGVYRGTLVGSRRVHAGSLVVAGLAVLPVAVSMLTVASGIGASCALAPQASFDYEVGDGTVTVTHAGGDTFDRENTLRLYATVDGEETDFTDELPVSEGDSVTVSADPAETVRVVWVGGERSQTVAAYAPSEDG
jgi:hypothetical protein